MKAILEQYYPSLKLRLVCRSCCGNSTEKCTVCKKSKAQYLKLGLDREIEEMIYLKATWTKAKIYKQISTGIKKLDFLITYLFGNPHDRYWRDYAKAANVNESNFIVLRISHV